MALVYMSLASSRRQHRPLSSKDETRSTNRMPDHHPGCLRGLLTTAEPAGSRGCANQTRIALFSAPSSLARPASSAMTLSKRTRARPKVEPINTHVINWGSVAGRASTRRSNAHGPLSPISPGTVLVMAPRDSRDDSTDQDGAAPAANRGRTAADLGLRCAPYGSPKSGLSLPGTREPGPRAWPSLDEVESHDWACCESPGGRRQTAPALTAAARESSFQQFRGHLWRRGSGQFGRVGRASVIVVPVELKRPSVALGEDSRERGTLAVSSTGLLPVRVGIRSKGGRMMALSRAFDLRHLRATIPEPLPSPRSPNFDRNALLAAVSPGGGMPTPMPPGPASAPGSRRPSAGPRSAESAGASPARRRWRGVGPCAVPIHICYARAFLPMLAAIMMSEAVGSGDRVYLPMPQPAAWRETAAYAYTGEAELVTEQVRQNVLHLGGKV